MLLNLVHAGMNSIGRNRVPSFPLTGRVNSSEEEFKKEGAKKYICTRDKGRKDAL